MAQLLMAGNFIGPGEARTAAFLEKNLPAHWTIIANKELLRADGSVREIDLIVIGEHSIFVIEEKSWSGNIYGNENGWVLKNGESLNSPISSVVAIAKVLSNILREQVIAMRTVGGNAVFGRVILSAKDVHLQVHDLRVHNHVLRLDDSADELQEEDKRQSASSSIFNYRESIKESLLSLPDRPKVPRKVGEYEVLESLSGYGSVRCLRARHTDGSERLLKLVPRPVTASPEKRREIENARLREYNALRRLADTGSVPMIDPFFSWDQEQFWVFPIHLLNGRSLRADRIDSPPDNKKIFQIIENAFASISQVHKAGILHRALNPDRIFICADGKVKFTDFVIARISGEQSIVEQTESKDTKDYYSAPECMHDLSLASSASDIFSLTASLLFWITGHEPPAFGTMIGSLSNEIEHRVGEIFRRCLEQEDFQVRPKAEELLEHFNKFRSQMRSLPRTSTTGDMQPGQIILDQYRIVRVLGEGGTAITYLAEDLTADSFFVLKKIKSQELVTELARTEFQSLKDLSHPNLPRVYDIRPANSPFHLKIEYIRGSSLQEMTHAYKGNKDLSMRIGIEILKALIFLEERNLIHRDLSPANILIPDEQSGPIKLIDFGMATKETEAARSVGTPRYRAPEIDRGGRWGTACDIYSLGVILFELLTGHPPYKVNDGIVNKQEQVEITAAEINAYGQRLLETLLKAASPDPLQRFKNSNEFLQALDNARFLKPDRASSGEKIINSSVNELRRSYRNSRVGNNDNRGLDSEFAHQTYVETKLDTDLLPLIISGRYRLIVLSGNPGDGKTAFLQKTRAKLISLGAMSLMDTAAGWRYKLNDHVFAALNDASESHEGRSADDLAHSLLAPLAGDTIPGSNYSALIAVNDGRLLNFFERHGEKSYLWLWKQIQAQLVGVETTSKDVLVVDLKTRALIGKSADEPSLFSRILDQFIAKERWSVCEECSARIECPILFNVLSFRDRSLSESIRSRFYLMLLAIHLKRERRPTVRDLRSALSYLITHDLGCSDIHKEREVQISPMARPERLYFNAAFDTSSEIENEQNSSRRTYEPKAERDLLLDEWIELDPAAIAHPRLDRFFYFHREIDQSDIIRSVLITASDRSEPIELLARLRDSNWLDLIKRRYFFEGRIETSLPSPEEIFAYHHFLPFISAIKGEIDESELIAKIARGISRSDGVPEMACRNALSLRMNQNHSDDITVIKQFHLSDFQIRRTGRRNDFTESIDDQLLFMHRSAVPSLLISLDLFEFLSRASEGYMPDGEEQRALIEDLAIFKNQLIAQHTQQVVIIEGGRKFHQVSLIDGIIEWNGDIE